MTETAVVALAAAAVSLLPRIPQPASYHSFAGDHRSLFGVPHGHNVLSNAAIAAPSVAGLWLLLSKRRRRAVSVAPMPAAERICWVATHLGMVLGEHWPSELKAKVYFHCASVGFAQPEAGPERGSSRP